MKRIKLFGLLTTILLCCSCNLYIFKIWTLNTHITFENNSCQDLYVCWDYNWYGNNSVYYSGGFYDESGLVKAKTKSSSALTDRNGFEEMLDHENCKKYGISDTIRVFIFDYNELMATPVNEREEKFVANYDILARYDLILENLESLNWELCYPPTEDLLTNMAGYWLKGNPKP